MRGRKPKPVPAAPVLTLVDTSGKKPAKPAKKKVSALPCPSHLTGMAEAEWARVVEMLDGMGVLSQASPTLLERYCTNYQRWREAEAHVAEHGAIVPAPRTGVPMQNPFLSVANAAGAVVDKLSIEMGLTPSARTRVGASNGAAASKKKSNARYFGQ